MANETSKQRLANLIQSYEQVVKSAQSLYDDAGLKSWAIDRSLEEKGKITEIKKKLKDTFSIDYDADTAKTKVIKEGSSVEVLVNHMDGMKGSTAMRFCDLTCSGSPSKNSYTATASVFPLT